MNDPAYLAGLRRELQGLSGARREAVLAEIERVGGKVPDASPPPKRPRQ
jgi:hypothetical protein